MFVNQVNLILKTEEDTQKLAKALSFLDISGSVWLSGDLGAGKTTLTRYWLRELGYEGSVKSPTYTLVESYQLGQHKQVYHADLYRLQDPEELDFIGFDEYLDENNALIIIEWASRAYDYLPSPVLKLDIHKAENDIREVSLSSSESSLIRRLNF